METWSVKITSLQTDRLEKDTHANFNADLVNHIKAISQGCVQSYKVVVRPVIGYSGLLYDLNEINYIKALSKYEVRYIFLYAQWEIHLIFCFLKFEGLKYIT